MALAQLDFIARAEVVHFLGPPGPSWLGKVEKPLGHRLRHRRGESGQECRSLHAGRADRGLGSVEREGRLVEKIRCYSRASLLIIDRRRIS